MCGAAAPDPAPSVRAESSLSISVRQRVRWLKMKSPVHDRQGCTRAGGDGHPRL